ncbi:hypothetical protein SAZ_04430 [Streptomyces noursei ZPM]|uniref:Uncharacterized protein n=1 Tax=Streptomyces noursei TaxID=1971 RepID=A0A059W075_STRNR|nr:DUF3558 family protein [Streptomyces noursei]AKA08463.1 hypothetical protein SAZ_04430 [Streptomyces noursei ZPM]AIA01302.1 hypothetical protein DC74_780 [Streptomyces noursei]EOT03032.1 hypothetical protein K530_15670 [Streptomyces noursei CCRC 11814]EXU90096.1 hypothetical protein P354_18850 [Streptomyces noursei PD-1]UWS70226.1 DUF3558 family protein [Streptomyces noursei]
MDQWDEEKQDWLEPARPVGGPPDGRSRRMLIVTGSAVVLVAAAVVGLWQLARDGQPDSPGWSGAPPSAPGGGWSSSPGGGSVASPGSDGLAAAPDPCAALDANTAAAWGLSAGRPNNPSDPQAGLKACSWSGTVGGAALTYTLIYAKDIPVSPEPTPTSVTGVPSASVLGNDQGCAIVWPTSFGKVFVHVKADTGTQPNLCDSAATFATQVAPRVPS